MEWMGPYEHEAKITNLVWVNNEEESNGEGVVKWVKEKERDHEERSLQE